MLAMWDARMSTASIAQIMGRSEARVHARLTQLRDARRAAARAAEPVVVVGVDVSRTPEPDTAVSLGPVGPVLAVLDVTVTPGGKRADVLRPRPPAAAVSVTAPRGNQPPVAGGPEPEAAAEASGRRLWTAAEDDIVRGCWRDHPGHAGTMAARMLDRPLPSVRSRAHALGLRQDGAPRTEIPALLRPTSGGLSARPVRRRPVALKIKPLTPRVLRWAGQFHVADWAVDEIADLFDLDADGLALALGVAP